MRLGVNNVLVKGGHTKSKFVEDVLLSKGKINIFRNKRIMILPSKLIKKFTPKRGIAISIIKE